MSVMPEDEWRQDQEAEERGQLWRAVFKRGSQGCLGVLTLVMVFGSTCAIIVSQLRGDDQAYSGGPEGCAAWRSLLSEASQRGFTTLAFREELIYLQDRTSTAEPEIRLAGAELLRSTTTRDVSAFENAARDMEAACDRYRY